MDPFQLRIYALFFLNTLRDEDIFTVSDRVINFNNTTTMGTLAINDFAVKGFDTLGIVDISDIEASEDEDGNNELCIKNMKIDSLDLSAKYVADIGINDTYPIYGDGDIRFGMNNVAMEFCTFISFNEAYIDDFQLNISYRHKPMSISGVLRHEEFSVNVTRYANAANAAFAMLNAYEPECGSCVLSPIFQYAFNTFTEYPNNSISINCPCVKEILGLGSEDIRFWMQYLRNK